MPTENVILTETGEAPLTQKELDYLEQFLTAGDRGGFYMAYYNMTGNEEAILQPA